MSSSSSVMPSATSRSSSRVQQRLHLVGVLGLRARVQLEHAGVGVGRHARVHRVGQPATLADLLEQPAGQAAAEHVVHHVERLAARVGAGQRAAAHHDVHLLAVVVDGEPLARRCRAAARCGHAPPVATPAKRCSMQASISSCSSGPAAATTIALGAVVLLRRTPARRRG